MVLYNSQFLAYVIIKPSTYSDDRISVKSRKQLLYPIIYNT